MNTVFSYRYYVRQATYLFWILVVVLLIQACSSEDSETHSWLLGHWQVAYNPSQDENDALLFQPGYRVRIEMESGRVLEGRYQIQQDQIIMAIQVGQRSVETQVQISADKNRLIFSNGAYYMKKGVIKERNDVPSEN